METYYEQLFNPLGRKPIGFSKARGKLHVQPWGSSLIDRDLEATRNILRNCTAGHAYLPAFATVQESPDKHSVVY